MTVTVDIGNTTIDFAVSRAGQIKKIWTIETEASVPLENRVKAVLRQMTRKYREVSGVMICSVVPPALDIIKPILEKQFKVRVVTVGRDLEVPLVNRYRNPRQVGQDRLVCAYAAMRLYGIPAIVIDLGTAITFDVVSGKKEYLGGIIVPGLRLSAESLFKKTALLPKVGIKTPGALIGRDTEASILSGLFYGYGVLCQGLVRLIGRQVRGRPKLVMTGGYAVSMRKFMAQNKPVIDESLVHRGMLLLMKERAKSSTLKKEC